MKTRPTTPKDTKNMVIFVARRQVLIRAAEMIAKMTDEESAAFLSEIVRDLSGMENGKFPCMWSQVVDALNDLDRYSIERWTGAKE